MNFEKIGKIVKLVVFIVVCFFAVVIIISAIPFPNGMKTYVVKSGSMSPTIKAGDVIFAVGQQNYGINDIVTYSPKVKSETIETITHRIVEIHDGNFVTKGDNNPDTDTDTVTLKQIKGKYITRFPYLGYLVSFLRTTLGFVLFIVVPGTIVIYEEIKQLIEYINNKEKNKKNEKNIT
jgi:signal peptidase